MTHLTWICGLPRLYTSNCNKINSHLLLKVVAIETEVSAHHKTIDTNQNHVNVEYFQYRSYLTEGKVTLLTIYDT